ncbi:hypothetical protein TrCOL_g4134 [Triparma columacea]|nr:hypothetical protein TrCOL_g4134 [Triparma columacea]
MWEYDHPYLRGHQVPTEVKVELGGGERHRVGGGGLGGWKVWRAWDYPVDTKVVGIMPFKDRGGGDKEFKVAIKTCDGQVRVEVWRLKDMELLDPAQVGGGGVGEGTSDSYRVMPGYNVDSRAEEGEEEGRGYAGDFAVGRDGGTVVAYAHEYGGGLREYVERVVEVEEEEGWERERGGGKVYGKTEWRAADAGGGQVGAGGAGGNGEEEEEREGEGGGSGKSTWIMNCYSIAGGGEGERRVTRRVYALRGEPKCVAVSDLRGEGVNFGVFMGYGDGVVEAVEMGGAGGGEDEDFWYRIRAGAGAGAGGEERAEGGIESLEYRVVGGSRGVWVRMDGSEGGMEVGGGSCVGVLRVWTRARVCRWGVVQGIGGRGQWEGDSGRVEGRGGKDVGGRSWRDVWDVDIDDYQKEV